jgi:hypothetical protein
MDRLVKDSVPNNSTITNNSIGVPNDSTFPNNSTITNDSIGVPNDSIGVPNDSTVTNDSIGVTNDSIGVTNDSAIAKASGNGHDDDSGNGDDCDSGNGHDDDSGTRVDSDSGDPEYFPEPLKELYEAERLCNNFVHAVVQLNKGQERLQRKRGKGANNHPKKRHKSGKKMSAKKISHACKQKMLALGKTDLPEPRMERPNFNNQLLFNTYSAVFSFVITVDDFVYRLAFIGYSRRSCGDVMEKEVTLMRPLREKITSWMRNKATASVTALEGPDIQWKDYTYKNEPAIRVVKFDPACSPDGYNSISIHLFELFSENCEDMTRLRWCELLYTMLMQNSAVFTYFIASRWLPNQPGHGRWQKAMDAGMDIPTLFLEECEAITISHCGATHLRWTASCGKNWPDGREDESVKKQTTDDVLALIKAIEAADAEGTTSKEIMDMVEAVPMLGRVTALPF